MKENEVVWRIIEQMEFNESLTGIRQEACQIVKDYELGKSEAILSNTQIQSLARMPVMMPGESQHIKVFSINPDFGNDLNNEVISDGIRGEFKKQKIALSSNAQVSIDGEEWWIIDYPGIFNIKKEGGVLNIYELRITRFIRHQTGKEKKADKGYRKKAGTDGIELGEAICRYLWYNKSRSLLMIAKEEIYKRAEKFMGDEHFSNPIYASIDKIHSRLVQEFIGHLVDCARIKRKERA
jgi:hypothetical protein